MKKKINLFIILITICALLTNNIYAYTYNTPYYTIEVPDTYEEISAGTLSDEEGNAINIQVKNYEGEVNFSQEELDELAQGMEESLSYNSEESLAALREANEASENPMTEEELVEYANALSYKVVEKDITIFGRNDYNCYHIVLKPMSETNSICMEQYMTFSGNTMYALLIASSNEDNLTSLDTVTAIDSFTINDGTQVKASGFAFEFVIIGIICAVLGIVVVIFILKYFRDKLNGYLENRKQVKK